MLYQKFKEARCFYSLAVHVCFCLCCRANSILDIKFEIHNFNEQFVKVEFPTKTVRHTILVGKKLEKRLRQLITAGEQLRYSRLLTFTKKTFAGRTTHQIRKSGISFLRSGGQFSLDECRLYGNWSVHALDTCSDFYLRSNTLSRIADFWESVL